MDTNSSEPMTTTAQNKPIAPRKSMLPARNTTVREAKELFTKAPSTYTSQTGVKDWEELVDDASGRVFFFSESLQQSQWGLPLESVGKTDQEREKLKGWCVYVDPTTHNKYFANELKAKAQWNYPGEGLKATLWKIPYLREKRSWAMEMQRKHNRPKPNNHAHALLLQATPTVKVLTLRELIQSLTLAKVVCDREAFKAFQIFASSFHAEENVLFYCVTEAFTKRGSKAVGVLGLDDLAKPNDKGLPRTQSHLNQIRLDQVHAEQHGTSVERVQMLREARGIYNRFISTGARDWVFVNPVLVEEIEQVLLEQCKDGNPCTPALNRHLFEKAQQFVFTNLEQDLLPRFVKASLTREQEGALQQPIVGSHGAFTPDEVLRHHLLQLQRKPDQVVTSLMSTANAYRSLFPSPRYAIEGREGSGLSPLNLDQELTALDEHVVQESKKPFNIVGRMLFPQPKQAPTEPRRYLAPPAVPQQQVKFQVLDAAAPKAVTAIVKPQDRVSIVELAGELNLDLEKFDVAH